MKNWFEQIALKNKLVLGFAIPLILLIAIASTVYMSLQSLLTMNGWVSHTYQAIDLGNSITSSLVNMETGLRGYLVAGKDEFLEPYHAGKKDFEKLTAETKAKVSDNLKQVGRIQEVEDIHRRWQTEHVQVSMGYRREVSLGQDAADHFAEISSRTVGKEKFDGFRAAIANLDSAFDKAGNTKALALVKALLMDMVNQETGQRGFLLTGKEESLEPYVQGQIDFKAHSAALLKIVPRSLRSDLNTAIAMAKDWRERAAEPEIDARRKMNEVTRTMGDVTEFIERGIGKGYMDEMRGILNAFVEEESMLIGVRYDAQKSTASFTTTVALLGTLIAVVISIIVTLFLTKVVLRQLGADPAELETVAETIAAGDLSIHIDEHSSSGVLASIAKVKNQLTQVIERELKSIIDSAKGGDLSGRIDLGDKEGFFEQLSLGINELVDVNERVLKDTSDMFSAMARGDLSHRINTDYSGAFNQLKQDANGTMNQLTDVIEKDVQDLVHQALKGNLSERISIHGKEGFFKDLSQGINDLVEVNENVLNDISRVMGALANGGLNERISANYEGAFAKIKDNSNETTEKLTEVVTKIKSSAAQVGTGSNEIAQGNLDLSGRTESQAASLEETASSMDELAQVVSQNSDNAKKATELAKEAEQNAEQGGVIVNQAVDAMASINEASNKISDIIGVIDEIAFQTNLLALNAAVEAARAGEQGRGFAVVAGEVRTLAQRSASAAKEIKDLIRDSVDKVETGTRLVNDSGSTLVDIVESVRVVVKIIEEISVSANEQSDGIKQVNSAINQIDDMTQQNAALVEQATAASKSMSEQAEEMIALMSFFNFNGVSATSQNYAPTPSSSVSTIESSNGQNNEAGDWEDF